MVATITENPLGFAGLAGLDQAVIGLRNVEQSQEQQLTMARAELEGLISQIASQPNYDPALVAKLSSLMGADNPQLVQAAVETATAVLNGAEPNRKDRTLAAASYVAQWKEDEEREYRKKLEEAVSNLEAALFDPEWQKELDDVFEKAGIKDSFDEAVEEDLERIAAINEALDDPNIDEEARQALTKEKLELLVKYSDTVDEFISQTEAKGIEIPVEVTQQLAELKKEGATAQEMQRIIDREAKTKDDLAIERLKNDIDHVKLSPPAEGLLSNTSDQATEITLTGDATPGQLGELQATSTQAVGLGNDLNGLSALL